MKKIVYIGIGTLTPILYENLCIDYFKENGIDVFYYDVTKLLFAIDSPKICYEIVSIIKSYQELEDIILQNNNYEVLYNLQINYENRFYKLFRLLKKHDCLISKFAIGYGPNMVSKHKIIGYIKEPLRLIKRIWNRFLQSLIFKLELVHVRFNIVFTAGKIAKNTFEPVSDKIVEINFIDYENFINNKAKTSEEIISFLDCFMANHEDIGFANNSSQLNPNLYIELINKFFERVEEKFYKNVEIVAHPKSNYKLDTFGGRKIIKNDTLKLVEKSLCVLSHHSTSVSYAVILNKPIIFFYTNEMEVLYKSGHIQFMKTLADILGMPCINIEREKLKNIPKVDSILYERYKYNYLITENSENLTNKEIIKRFVATQ